MKPNYIAAVVILLITGAAAWALDLGVHVGTGGGGVGVGVGTGKGGPSVGVGVGTSPPSVGVGVHVPGVPSVPPVTPPPPVVPPVVPPPPPNPPLRDVIRKEVEGLSSEQIAALLIICQDVLAHPEKYSPIKLAICQLLQEKAEH